MVFPAHLVTALREWLEPHIRVAAALYQVFQVVETCGCSDEAVRKLVNQYTEGLQFGFLGEPRVNVLEQNLALDGLR